MSESTPEPSFPIIVVQADRDQLEPIGSKEKFWFRDGSDFWLFKQARANTGENWAEKIAAELAGLLGLPHAQVELATHEGSLGIVTTNFTNLRIPSVLVHGNELLFMLDKDYPKSGRFHVSEHTVKAVRGALKLMDVTLPHFDWPDEVRSAWDGFIGYLLLDALIANTDRHHQNWGVIASSDANYSITLAPTYDHASSLGRELEDEARVQRLTTRDSRGNVAAYASRARSALYGDEGGSPLSPVEAFATAASLSPEAGRSWLLRLPRVDAAAQGIVDRVPGPIMSDPARRFALALLHENRSLLEAVHV
jgi:hypothetical protein